MREDDPHTAKSKVKGQRVWTREPKHLLGFSIAADVVASQLISVPATGTPSSRRPSTGRSDGATFRFGGVAAESGGQSTYPQQSRRSTPDIGYRALREAGCPENTLATHHSPRGSPCLGEAEAIVSSIPGQLRVGKARSLQGSRLHLRSTPQDTRPFKSTRPSSQRPSSDKIAQQVLQHNCPDGFQFYMKEVKQLYHQNGQAREIVSEDGGRPVFSPTGKWIRE